MIPRERWLALLENEKPDRVPTDYWATSEVTKRLLCDLQCSDTEELFTRLHIDAPYVLNPIPTVTCHPEYPSCDIWGRKWVTIAYETGEYAEITTHPLAQAQTVEDIHAFNWPNPDHHDFDAFKQAVDTAPSHRILRAGYYEPFLLYCQMRGMEQAMMDLVLEPEITDAALGHIFDYYYRLNNRLYEIGKGKVELTFLAEDLGSQESLLIGLDSIRRFILPNQRKMADLARSFGIHIFYHTDGASRPAIDDLVNTTGIEILNPIQWRCSGMEREGLVQDFGQKIIFHGAVDNQQTLPFGTPEDVRQEVLDNLQIFSNCRWICASCHNLQPVSSTANIVALYETIYQNGKL
jgi:uroporphyrinogen decarboxylase